MKKTSTSDRLKEIMKSRNLRQVDILEKIKPYSQKYGIKMNKSDLSQYVSGIVEPGQEKLSILGMALNVNEVWLMGYNVPTERSFEASKQITSDISDEEQALLNKYRSLDDKGKHTVSTVLEMEYNRCNDKLYLLPDAAHEIEEATEEDKQHDEDLMNDDNF